MNVGFIIAPSPFLSNEKVFPSLGILRIAAYLESQKFNVKILDLSGQQNVNKLIDFFIKENSIDVIGISAVSPQMPIVYNIAKYIKNSYNNIKLIIGGPHIILTYSSIKNKSQRLVNHFEEIKSLFDVIIIGDGELAMIKALEKDSPKIIDVELDNKYLITNEIYEQLPFPARHLIDINSYEYKIGDKKSTSLIGQLGCPFNCGFCGGRNCKTYKSIRVRSSHSIINEIDELINKYNFNGFMFYDDELNVNEQRFNILLEDLIKYQEKNKIELSFRGFSRADLLTEKQANLMYKAGFRWLLIGFESGSDRILKNMNKNTTVKQNTNSFKIARKYGLKVKALMSIGHPGESIDSIKETSDWINQVKPDEVDFTIITLYPGSKYFDESIYNKSINKWIYEKNGERLYSDNINFLNDSCFYKSKIGEYNSYIETDYLSKIDLIKYRNELELGVKKCMKH